MPCTVLASKSFANGNVHALRTASGVVVETTDTFLPSYTKDAAQRGTNTLLSPEYGCRKNRWMIGVSTLSGCPIRCRFCACNEFTDRRGWKALSSREMVEQVEAMLAMNPGFRPAEAEEFKVLFSRMGEPGLNGTAVLGALEQLHDRFPNLTAAVSTIGVGAGDFLERLLVRTHSWRKDFIQLQLSLHSTNEVYRGWLIPVKLLSFKELGEFGIRWRANPNNTRKITLNFTLTEGSTEFTHGDGFEPTKLAEHFPAKDYFIKLSPLNQNITSDKNNLVGVIPQSNY